MTAKTEDVRDLQREPAAPVQGESAQDAPLPHDRDERSVPAKEDAQHRHNRRPIDQARKRRAGKRRRAQ